MRTCTIRSEGLYFGDDENGGGEYADCHPEGEDEEGRVLGTPHPPRGEGVHHCQEPVH